MSSWLAGKSYLGESFLARFRTSLPLRDGVDMAVQLEGFEAHWQQAWNKMQSHMNGATATMEEVNFVLNHTDQLMMMLCWELQQRQDSLTAQNQQQQQEQCRQSGCVADLFLGNRVPERLLAWSGHCGEFALLLHSELLRLFEELLRAGGGALLEQRAVLRPLTDLLLRCRLSTATELHRRLVQVLSRLCEALHTHPALLDLFLTLQPDGSASSFVIFALLVEFVHRDGVVGSTAREALLLCMRLSADSEQLAGYIVQHSNFCVVLATGLSGLYSALPRTAPSDDEQLPEVDAFVSSLEFCNSVLEACHPLIAAQLQELVYQGFLVSVMGPALHQSSVEAVVTATTYLELCVRSVDHPRLVRALLRLLLRHRHDGVTIVDTLVQRIAATPRLAVATLSLLHTLLNLNCEDVMLELVLRHLLPCTHLMASQRARVTETDLYGAGARRLLALVPACCQPAAVDAAAWYQCGLEARAALTACRRATRGWTYAYDGMTPSPAEVERMARRRDGAAAQGLSVEGRLEERGEADGEAGEAATAPAATAGTPAATGAAAVGAILLNDPSADVPADLTPSLPRSSLPPSQEAPEQTLGGGSSSSPPHLVASPADRWDDTDTSISTQPWATPAAGAELDLSADDLWSTPRSFAGHSGRQSEVDLEVGSLKLGILSLLPSEPLSETDGLGREGEPWSLASGDSSRESESVRRRSPPPSVPADASSTPGDVPPPSAAPAGAGEPAEADLRSLNGDDTRAVAGGSVADSDGTSATPAAERPPAAREEVAADSGSDSGAAAGVSRDLSSFVERHRGAVRAPPPPPTTSPYRSPLSYLPSTASEAAGAIPNIGPFLLAVLERLDLATTNSLQLNLLLMSVVSRLSHYPQPLLRSLLLNPTLVFQPSVRSLIQTLGSLKHRIDLATRSVQDTPGLVRWARGQLEARGLSSAVTGSTDTTNTAAGGTAAGSTGPASLPARLTQPAAAADADSGGFSLTGLAGRLRRALPTVTLTMESSDHQTRRRPLEARLAAVSAVGASEPEWDSAERRLAITAVLMEQWLAELAAVALEHSVTTDQLLITIS